MSNLVRIVTFHFFYFTGWIKVEPNVYTRIILWNTKDVKTFPKISIYFIHMTIPFNFPNLSLLLGVQLTVNNVHAGK